MTPHDFAAAYAIDALDPAERASFARHLDECPSCQDQVRSVHDAAAHLGATGALSGVGSPGPAPASLRTSVLAGVGATSQVSSRATPGRASFDPAIPDPATPDPAADPPARIEPARTRRHFPVAWIGVAASAIVALALGVGVGGFLASDADDPSLATHEQAMRIISASDAHTMSVPLGRSSLVMSEDYGGAVLMGDTTPMPAHGTEYQIWMSHPDGTVAPGPTFMPDADGTYMVLVSGDMGDVATVMVTTEPPGGSMSPTGPMVAEVSLGT